MILYVNLVLCILFAMITALARDQIAAIFTNNELVREMVSQVLILLSFFFIVDGMQSYLQAPIRAMGLQKVAYILTLASYYIIGLPLACLFSLKFGWGVIGLEAGFGIAVFLLLIYYGVLLCRTDW